jgi:hypothetical protein
MAIGRACFLVALACAAAGAFGRTFVPQDKARVAEIARMLSGDVGEASLAHAREMLAAV